MGANRIHLSLGLQRVQKALQRFRHLASIEPRRGDLAFEVEMAWPGLRIRSPESLQGHQRVRRLEPVEEIQRRETILGRLRLSSQAFPDILRRVIQFQRQQRRSPRRADSGEGEIEARLFLGGDPEGDEGRGLAGPLRMDQNLRPHVRVLGREGQRKKGQGVGAWMHEDSLSALIVAGDLRGASAFR